ncbi:MAG: hypothetical protein M0D57_14575 [Sphingobacteriales bacterium JAD_PAG50586_3]|nr:MAG: hypothetical protein M0D57_14575 [Sphingobacteriales bacterium JAD_PAG50586_3]
MRLKQIILALFMMAFFSIIALDIIGFKTKKLHGEFEVVLKPELTWEEFYGSWFQDKYAEYLRTNFALRSKFILMYNQLDYSLYNKLHAPGTVIGKEDEFFEIGRIKPLYGEDFVSMPNIQSKIDMLRFVADTLAKQGKPLVILLAGDKPRVMHKYLPDKYQKNWADTSNFSIYTSILSKEKNIRYIDFESYSMRVADTSKVPIYPKYSLHWSTYTMYLAIDSLRKVVDQQVKNKTSAIPVLKGFEKDVNARYLEYEMINILNLYFPYTKTENIYPKIEYKQPIGTKKPFIIQIGDSFGELLLEPGYYTSVFNDSSLVFRYNAIVKSRTGLHNSNVNDIDYWSYINKADAIVIVTSELNLDNFGMGFIEKAYNHYKGTSEFFDYIHPFRVKEQKINNTIEYVLLPGDRTTFFKNRNFNVKAGKKYALTFEAKGEKALIFDLFPDFLPQYKADLGPNWKNYRWEFSMPENEMPEQVAFRIFFDVDYTFNKEMRIRNFKLEEVK